MQIKATVVAARENSHLQTWKRKIDGTPRPRWSEGVGSISQRSSGSRGSTEGASFQEERMAQAETGRGGVHQALGGGAAQVGVGARAEAL